MQSKKTIKEAALEILKEEGKPLHYKDLTKRIIPLCNFTGKTPHESVRSLIGTDERFKRVAEGVYALTEWVGYPVARFAKDIAFEKLKARNEWMLRKKLGMEIRKERDFYGTPIQIVRNVMRTDTRFILSADGEKVGLTEWKNNK